MPESKYYRKTLQHLKTNTLIPYKVLKAGIAIQYVQALLFIIK